MSQHIAELVRIAQVEMPGLEYDIGSASTTLSQKVVIERLQKILTLVLHHVILDYYEQQTTSPRHETPPTPRRPQPPSPSRPQTIVAPPPHVQSVQVAPNRGLPSLPPISTPPAPPANTIVPSVAAGTLSQRLTGWVQEKKLKRTGTRRGTRYTRST